MTAESWGLFAIGTIGICFCLVLVAVVPFDHRETPLEVLAALRKSPTQELADSIAETVMLLDQQIQSCLTTLIVTSLLLALNSGFLIYAAFRRLQEAKG